MEIIAQRLNMVASRIPTEERQNTQFDDVVGVFRKLVSLETHSIDIEGIKEG